MCNFLKIKRLSSLTAILSLCLLVTLFAACNKNDSRLGAEDNLALSPDTDRFQTIDEARLDVETLINDMNIGTKNAIEGEHRKIQNQWQISTTTKSGINSEDIYVFNFEDSLGYAVVSSDNAKGLLGIALNGHLEEDSEIANPGLVITLANLESGEAPFPQEDIVYGPWENIFYEPSSGYCQVKWGQRGPYNQYCFAASDEIAVTGCVATAVAQLMSLYKYPSTCSTYQFDWDSMNSSAYSTNDLGDYYVARLMQQLGLPANLDVEYGTVGSSASPSNIPRTLTHFGYSSGGTFDDFVLADVIDELIDGYPILLGGYSHKKTKIKKVLGITVSTEVTYENGHRWLVHGLLKRQRLVTDYTHPFSPESHYEYSYYLLCNFGWDGLDDGFYSINAYDTNQGPVYDESIITRGTTTTIVGEDRNYQFHITAVTGIRM